MMSRAWALPWGCRSAEWADFGEAFGWRPDLPVGAVMGVEGLKLETRRAMKPLGGIHNAGISPLGAAKACLTVRARVAYTLPTFGYGKLGFPERSGRSSSVGRAAES
jgi:hypothetical protein